MVAMDWGGYGAVTADAKVRAGPYDVQPSHGNVFVGNLPQHVGTEDLKQRFQFYGEVVSCKVVTEPATGISRGLGFVKFAQPAEAQNAIEAMNGTDGLVVKFAENDVGANKGKGFSKGSPTLTVKYAGADQVPSDNLYILGLPSDTTQASVSALFAGFGLSVQRSKVMPDTRGTGITAAMVQVESQDEASAAIEVFHGQSAAILTEYNAAAGPAALPSVGAQRGPISLVVKYAGQAQEPSDNLYITGLPPSMDQASLNSMFTSMGLTVVRSRVIPDTRGTGIGAAMVQLSSMEEASLAIETFNGQVVEMPAIVASSGPPGGGEICTLVVKYAGVEQTPSDNLYIAGLPGSIDQATLNETFSSLGFIVVRSRIIPDTRGTGKGAAMVQLESQEQAAAAIDQLNGSQVQAPEQPLSSPDVSLAAAVASVDTPRGRPLTVKYAGAEQLPSDNLFVSNLPTSGLDLTMLNQAFEQLGLTVQRSRILPSSGWDTSAAALVQLASEDEAATAIASLNGQVVFLQDETAAAAASGPRGVLVPPPGRAALPPPPPPPVAGGARPAPSTGPWKGGGRLTVKYSGAEQFPSDNLYLVGLPACMDQGALNEMFSNAGFTVQRSRVMPDKWGNGPGAAMMQVASLEEAAAAIAHFNGQEVVLDGNSYALAHEAPAWQPRHVAPPQWRSSGSVVAPPRNVPPSKTVVPQKVPVVVPARNVVPKKEAAATPQIGGPYVLNVKYAGDGTTPSDNLYISGLPPSTDQGVLVETFSNFNFAVVRSKLIPDTRGLGKAAAMVQLGSIDEATAAIEALNGKHVEAPDYEPAAVAVPDHKSQRWAGDAQRAGGHFSPSALVVKYAGAEQTPSDNLYMTGLPPTIDQATLQNTFFDLGLTIVRSRIIPDTKGTGRGAAMVQLASMEEAAMAIEQLNGQIVAGVTGADGTAGATPTPPPPPPPAGPRPQPGILSVKYSGPTQTPSDNLYLMGFPATSVDDATLKSLFASIDLQVVRCKCIPDTRGTGMCGAMVQLASMEQAATAIAGLNGQPVQLG